MKYPLTQRVQLKLDIIQQTATYGTTGLPCELALPLPVVITSDACAYHSCTNIGDDDSMIDESPETLGYYWIEADTCLRTTKGLAFKPAGADEKPQQTHFLNGREISQVIDWTVSMRPDGYPKWRFKRLRNQSAILNLDTNGDWLMTIEDIPHRILVAELDIEIDVTSDTGFERNGASVCYYGRPLEKVDADTFEVLNINYARDINHIYHADSIVACDYHSFIALNYCVSKDKSQVFSGSIPFSRADVLSFRLAGKSDSTHYFKDKFRVFCSTTELAGADPDTFEVLNEYYAKDASYVFRFSDRQDHLDAHSFELIDDEYCQDKNGIYACDWDTPRVCDKVDDFTNLEFGYFCSKNKVYYYNDANDKSQLVSETVDAFRFLSGYWACDEQKVFYQGELMAYATIADFEDLGGEYVRIKTELYFRNLPVEADIERFELLEAGFARDNKQLFYLDESIEGASPESFFIIDNTHFADARQMYFVDDRYEYINIVRIPESVADLAPGRIIVRNHDQFLIDNFLYVDGILIENVDVDTYETLTFGYAKDRNTAYFMGRPLLGMTGDAEVLGHEFITDGSRVYYENTLLPLEAKRISLIKKDIIKDNKKVFRLDRQIEAADAETYKLVNHWFERDKYRYYHWGNPIPLDIQSAEVIDDSYVKDQERIYYFDFLIANADVSSFEPLEGNFSKDNFRVYFKGKPLIGVDAASFEITGFNQSQDKNSIYGIRQGEVVKLRDRNTSLR